MADYELVLRYHMWVVETRSHLRSTDMSQVLIGDVFESKYQTWVNTVNCVGVMGNGVAPGVKKCSPNMFEDYKARCHRNEVKLGQPYIFKQRRLLWGILCRYA